ncbi:hypothetical protein MCUN1_003847 [Malassezia cuniculi]|uniref:Tr-type G domain-containing protein n=1 Tax=Malassezia cuniculi TaxID=948313 RepID=A0AAF0EUA6_9BASI|nr:hypothetical protein MCUN1_003847 [Malassezia cuniculi]
MDDYDEFGNYIGPLSDSGSEGGDELPPLEDVPAAHEAEDVPEQQDAGLHVMQVDDEPSNAVVLHEEKIYYPSAAEVYGEDVETLVQEEDTQPLTQPIIEPERIRSFAIEEHGLPETRFDRSFMMGLMQFPDMVRNVAVVGHLHHGKTALVDLLVEQTHKVTIDAEKQMRYTDVTKLEIERGISIKAAPMSLVMPDSSGKSYLLNVLDTPGHVNFQDEVAAALRLADGAVLVVDVVEGVMVGTAAAIRYCVRYNLPIVVVLNKIDRLILELRLPPQDAYFKIRHTLEEINSIIGSATADPAWRVSPERGNVAFASASNGWCFTLRTFAALYARSSNGVDVDAFAARLWGDIYFQPKTRNFTRHAQDAETPRSFIQFVLEPLYKLHMHVLAEESNELHKTLSKLGIYLPQAAFRMDVRPLLRLVMTEFVGAATGFMDMLVKHVPSALAAAPRKTAQTYTGPAESAVYQAASRCDASGPLLIQIAKLYPTSDASEFRAFGRVLSGTATVGQPVKVLGEDYSADDDEDMALTHIGAVWVNESRYTVDAAEVPAGSWALLGNVDASISQTATICDAALSAEETYILRPIDYMTESVLKVAVEPLNPSELPKMLEGLRKVNKSYPLLQTKVEESGEHTLLGTGELYLDCVMHDLRVLFSEIEIKISDPVAKFCETVVETSAVQCYAQTPNKRNKLTMIAEPLEKGVAEDIERGLVNVRLPPRELAKIFQERYGWDALAARSIWAFGPDEGGPNVLVDDTLPDEVDKKMLYSIRESIKQGFQWAAREGPLSDEPMRNVKFRITNAEVAAEPIYRGGGQIIPTARRVAYAAFLLASPRLMEPIYYVEILAPPDSVAGVYTLLARRRGHVTQDIPKAGTQLVTIKAYIPVMDSCGFETDLRVLTQGQAFCLQTFDHWSVVPGDPMDSSITLRPLEPAPPLGLARDFVLKIRRRKGLSDTIAVSSYLESDMVVALAQAGLDLN